MHSTPRLLLVLALLLIGAPPSSAGAPPADRVAYTTFNGLTVRDLDGGQPLALGHVVASEDVRRGDDGLVQWFPDGRRLIFADDEGVKVLTVDEPEEATLLVGGTQSFDLSPDGRMLAVEGLRVLPLDREGLPAGPLVQVTEPPGGDGDFAPVWAPDSSAIAFQRGGGAVYSDLRVVDLGVGQPTGPVADRMLLDRADYLLNTPPSWLPDASGLVFTAVPRLGQLQTPQQLYRVDRGGGPAESLVQGTRWQPNAPVPSPDGLAVAYERRCIALLDENGCTGDEAAFSAEGGVWLHDLDAGTDRQIAVVPGEERSIEWRADGDQVVFEAFTQDSGCHCDVSDLYLADVAAGGSARQLEGLDSGQLLYGPLNPSLSTGITQQLSGPTRIETAVAVSRSAFESADTVVLARADNYPDALSGSGLAGALNGPLLLSHTDGLPEAVAREILRLGATTVILLGDESALSAQVAADVQASGAGPGVQVDRIAGVSRFDTAANVAERLNAFHGYVVLGGAATPEAGWPDAVATAGVAAVRGQPLLLVEQDRLPPETAAVISGGQMTAVTIVGGEAAISAEVERQIADLGVALEPRLAGATRYETSRLVAEHSAGFASTDSVWMATGRNWPDTLAAGAAAARTGGVLLLLDGVAGSDNETALDLLSSREVDDGWLVGGPDVLAPPVRVAVERTQ